MTTQAVGLVDNPYKINDGPVNDQYQSQLHTVGADADLSDPPSGLRGTRPSTVDYPGASDLDGGKFLQHIQGAQISVNAMDQVISRFLYVQQQADREFVRGINYATRDLNASLSAFQNEFHRFRHDGKAQASEIENLKKENIDLKQALTAKDEEAEDSIRSAITLLSSRITPKRPREEATDHDLVEGNPASRARVEDKSSSGMDPSASHIDAERITMNYC